MCLTTQNLFSLAPRSFGVDHSQPYFSLAFRTDSGPWITFVATNDFFAFTREYMTWRNYFREDTDLHMLVERLEQDKIDNCRYNTTVMEQC